MLPARPQHGTFVRSPRIRFWEIPGRLRRKLEGRRRPRGANRNLSGGNSTIERVRIEDPLQSYVTRARVATEALDASTSPLRQ